MTDRWSNPSGGLGVHRFSVWPGGLDSYDHAENAANWDKADAIIGVPASGDWPPTTGVNGGIYKEVRLLQLERLPIGAVIQFFRPTSDYALPDGFEVLDGRTIAPSEHDFTGISDPVTLTDMRNAFVLGADADKANGTSAVAVGNTNIELASGAPGPQATGGLNQVTQTLSQMPSHNHGGGAHTHTFGRQVIQLPTGGANYLINVRDQRTHSETTDSSAGIITTQGGGAPMENRPRYVGLIFLVKCRFADSI